MGFFSKLGASVKKSAATTVPKTAATALISGVASTVSAAAAAAKKKQQTSSSAKKSSGGGGGDGGGGGGGGAAPVPAEPPVDKSNLLQWGDIGFYVKPTGIRTFKGLSIKSSTTVETEENGDDAYVKKKKNGAYEVTFTAILDKRLGEGDVLSAARHILECCRNGYSGYLYTSGTKVVASKMMGTAANIQNVLTTPNGVWISCEIQITMKQCSKLTGSVGASPSGSSSSSGGGGGGGSSKKYTVQIPGMGKVTVVAKSVQEAISKSSGKNWTGTIYVDGKTYGVTKGTINATKSSTPAATSAKATAKAAVTTAKKTAKTIYSNAIDFVKKAVAATKKN